MNFLKAVLSLKTDESNGIFRNSALYGIGLVTNRLNKQTLTSINDRGWSDAKGISQLAVEDILADDWVVITLKKRIKDK